MLFCAILQLFLCIITFLYVFFQPTTHCLSEQMLRKSETRFSHKTFFSNCDNVAHSTLQMHDFLGISIRFFSYISAKEITNNYENKLLMRAKWTRKKNPGIFVKKNSRSIFFFAICYSVCVCLYIFGYERISSSTHIMSSD